MFRFFNKHTKNKEVIPCGLLIYSIGYQTLVLDGIPKNEKVTSMFYKISIFFDYILNCELIALFLYIQILSASLCRTQIGS